MSQRRRQRGATLIEYAFLVALLVIPLSRVVGGLQDAEKGRLETSSQRVGMPEEFASNTPTGGNGTAGSGSDTTTNSTAEVTISVTGNSSAQGSKKWTAVVEIEVTSTDGAPILDAELTGTWQRVYADGTTTVEEAHCSADSSGVCTLSLWNLRAAPHESAVDQVIFTVTALTATDATLASGVLGSAITVLHP
ncbi:MAG: hypothetical protein R2706_05930 [Acidimicrobiales bacterium]